MIYYSNLFLNIFIVGSLFSMIVSNKLSSKKLVIYFLICDIGFLLLFIYCKSYFLLCLARFGAGFFKVKIL